jgi:hypothetical protein
MIGLTLGGLNRLFNGTPAFLAFAVDVVDRLHNRSN